jgi:predicted nucleic acid-binding protein
LTAYVLDASVAAKWVLPSRDEPFAAESIRLLRSFAAGEINLSVPDLFWPEIGNILWKSVRAGRISGESAYEAIDWLHALKIPTSPTMLLLGDAVRIAVSFERTVYDSLYLALAIASGRPLVTADERLANAVGARLPICWLGSVV